MTIDEAIEILQVPGIPWSGEALENHYKARQLGIEALKAVQEARNLSGKLSVERLPGETKD